MLSTLLTLALASSASTSTVPPLSSQDPLVTIEATGAPLSEILPALSEKVGKRLAAGSGAADDVVFIQVKDMPASVLMQRIAAATGNRWTTDGTITRLVRDPEAEKVAREAARAHFAKAFRAGLDRQGGPVAAGSVSSTVNGVQIGSPAAAIDESPASQGLKRMLAALDINRLSDLDAGERIVFATSPTPMQVGLPGSFNTEGLKIARDSAAERERQRPRDERTIRMMTPMDDLGTIDGDINRGVGKVLIAARRVNDSMFDFQMIVADTQGKTLAVASRIVSVDPPAVPVSDGFTPKLNPNPLTKELATLLAPPSSAAGITAGGEVTVVMAFGDGNLTRLDGSGALPSAKLSAGLKARLHDLKAYHPARFGLEEGFTETFKDQSVVALLPDEAIVPVLQSIGRNGQPAATWNQYTRHVKLSKDDHGWVGTPVDLLKSRQSRIVPNALSRALKAADQSPVIPLSVAIDFAGAQSKRPDGSHLDGALFQRLAPSSILDSMSGQMGAWPTVRLLASVGPVQRNTLSNGRPLALNALGPAALTILRDDVFNSFDGPNRAAPGQPIRRNVTVGGTPGGGAFMISGFGANLASERTEFLPNGIPGQGTLTVRTDQQGALLAKDSKSGVQRLFGARSYGLSQNLAANPALAGTMATYDLFQPLGSAQYRFNYLFAPEVTMMRSLSDYWMLPGTQATAFEQLPEAIRKEVEEGRNMATRANIGRFEGGRAAPPPP